MLRTIARTVLPASVRRSILSTAAYAGKWRAARQMARLRRRMYALPAAAHVTEPLLHYTVRVNHGPNFYAQYKDVFVNRIYHFEAQRPDPRILDCGSNIGGTILYFKHVYPQAQIIGFEPDPALFPYLQENVQRNGLQDVQLVQAAIAGREGILTFYSDGKSGSCLVEYLPANIRGEWQKYEVPCIRLRPYLIEPTDFLKMNIEGAEYEVLEDCADQLRMIREMVIEYHHHPGLPRTLHKILALLHDQGFEYLINDFDMETNGAVQPPFRLKPDTYYWLLIYAHRLD